MVSEGCGKSLFATLTLVTLGTATGLLVASLVYFIEFKVQTVSDALFIAVVIAVSVSFLLLLFGFWASIWGGRCSKSLLAIFYLVYAIALGGLGIVVLVLKNRIITQVGKVFDTNTDFHDHFTSIVNCTGWSEEGTTCLQKVQDFFKTFGVGVSAGLIVLFVILLVGDIFAWRVIFCSPSAREELSGSKPGAEVTTPLRYSW
jgi:hypothetical protein